MYLHIHCIIFPYFRLFPRCSSQISNWVQLSTHIYGLFKIHIAKSLLNWLSKVITWLVQPGKPERTDIISLIFGIACIFFITNQFSPLTCFSNLFFFYELSFHFLCPCIYWCLTSFFSPIWMSPFVHFSSLQLALYLSGSSLTGQSSWDTVSRVKLCIHTWLPLTASPRSGNSSVKEREISTHV